MSTQVANVNKINSGLCPHGLPPGACPICSNAAGSMRQSDRNRNVGEMTYHECAMIGNMMRAKELAQKRHENNLEIRAESLKTFEQIMNRASTSLAEFAQRISTTLLLKPVAFIIQRIAIPVVNLIKNTPNIINNIAEKFSHLKQKIFDIMDKLNAIFGELKAFIDKKISEFVSAIKTKFKNIFKIFKKNNTDDNDTKVDDDKKNLNLKTILHKIKINLKSKKDQKNE